jgi:hypothetical protein
MFDRTAHWQQVYQDKSPLEVSWYQQEPTTSLQLIARARPDKETAMIDVGGGASQWVDCLVEQGFTRLTVLDISKNALDWARGRLAQRAQLVDWQAIDVIDFRPTQRYGIWHDRAVFHFLTGSADRQRYCQVLRLALEAEGQAIIGTFAPGGPTQCSGLDIVQYDADRLLAELGKGFQLREQTSEIHLTPAGKEQAFNFFRVQRIG